MLTRLKPFSLTRKERRMGFRALILLTALVAAASIAGEATAGVATAPCTTAGLVVWLDTAGNSGAGSTFLTLKFTNQSGHACVLTGYPGVSALDLRGHILGSPASRNPSTTRAVRLADGATASAALRIVQAANFPPASCNRRAAAGLRVFPPNQTVSKVVPLPFEACAHTGPVFLNVKAVSG
jgi:hypothetical protein